MLRKVISYLESSGYRVIGRVEGSGKYEILLLERGGAKYVARVGARDCVFESSYCREISSCPNIAVPEFVNNSISIAIRRYLPYTLRDIIEKRAADDVAVASIILDLCRALSCIHSKELVYTDLKPENVGVDGRHAFLIDTDSLTRPFSRPRFITMDYAPPEYIEWGIVVKESDLYQLGMVIKEVSACANSDTLRSELESIATELTAKNPFARPSTKVIEARIARLVDRLS
ncbi:MAG: protein kinase [Crenarchaeota archaeon]|nr:protein kinase [Thermoproteota archaeon]